jgi:peptide chain release factor 1
MELRLDEALRSSGHAAVNGERADQIGCGSRADKRRTYRFQDGLVTDHETGKTASARKVMRGEMDLLW